MKIALFALFGLLFATGLGLMIFGYRKNAREGSKRYHPGNRWINIGLLTIILCGMALAMLGWASLT